MTGEIVFSNSYYNECVLKPANNLLRFKQTLQEPKMLANSSLGDKPDRSISDEVVEKVFNKVISQYQQYKIGFYEIHSKTIFLGLIGFFLEPISGNLVPELCWYILSAHQNRRIGSDAGEALVAYIFNNTSNNVIIADAFSHNNSTKIIKQLGFQISDHQFQRPPTHRQYGQIRYELKRSIWGLRQLSQIFVKEGKNLLPKTYSMAYHNMDRVTRLWYAYFHYGILLSNGGVRQSLITMDSLQGNPNLASFEMYRSDRENSIVLPPNKVKEFLVEENVIPQENAQDIDVAFSFGSHEGFSRLTRCLYQRGKNDAFLYPGGGYGFLASTVATMKPAYYNVHIIKVDKTKGEKIILDDLLSLIRRNPTAKTLFFELKTTAGANYTNEELYVIINICKNHDIFLILDIAHANMEFDSKDAFPNFIRLCYQLNYYQFAVIYTGSKTYGLERARIGFVILSKKINRPGFFLTMSKNLYRTIGSANDLPFEIAYKLIHTPLEDRKAYLRRNAQQHRFNLNVMIGYVESIESPMLDPDLKLAVIAQIPPAYHSGIAGIRILYKPAGGIQVKFDVSGLKNKFFYNIQMSNAEIFSYALNKAAHVVTLHAFQIMDIEGYGMRISFSLIEDVHRGMQAIHGFVASLTDHPVHNPFMPDIEIANNIVYPSAEELQRRIDKSKEKVSPELLQLHYKQYIRKQCPFTKLSDHALTESINNAAQVIQKAWRTHRERLID